MAHQKKRKTKLKLKPGNCKNFTTTGWLCELRIMVFSNSSLIWTFINKKARLWYLLAYLSF